MRKISAALYTMSLLLAPVSAIAAPYAPTPGTEQRAALQVDGWWEQSHHFDVLRDRYWHLPPDQRARYDELQFQIQQLQQEQHRILRFGEWAHQDRYERDYGPNPPPRPYERGYGPN